VSRHQDGCGPPLGVGPGAAGHAFRRLRPSHNRRPRSRRRLPLELDVAFLLNARLLDRDYLAFHVGELRGSLFVTADKKCGWPEHGGSSRRDQAVSRPLAALGAGKAGRSLRNTLSHKPQLLAVVGLVHDRRNVRRRDI
jgi:hypothetical protein